MAYCSSPVIRRFAVLAAIALASPLYAADGNVTADVEVFYPVPAGGRGGGVAAMGVTQMEAASDASPDKMIRVTGTKDPIGGAWWFPNHLPMTTEQAHVGDKAARLVIDIEAAAPTKTAINVRWRYPEGKSGEPQSSSEVQLKPGTPTRITLPAPAAEAGTKITGLVFGFTKPGDYKIRRVALALQASVNIDLQQPGVPQNPGDITVSGNAVAGVSNVVVRFTPEGKEGVPFEKTAAAQGGKFKFVLKPTDLTPGVPFKVTAEPQGRSADITPAKRLFVWPQFAGQQNLPVIRVGADLIRDGKRFGFAGFNYTRMGLGLSVEANYELLAHDVMQMKRWGTRAVRMTVDMGLTQPEPGVFPDSPRYAELMKAHNLDPRYMDQVDYFIRLAGEQGIYTVLDWHGMPCDPYRYFLGGKPSDRDTGKPGTAIAYLAKSPTEEGEFNPTNSKHQAIMTSCHTWLASHYKGNPNVLGIEIPYNEPHTTEMAVEANWRHVVDLAAKAVASGDPDRMTFIMAPSYGHNNLLPSVTWMPPDRATGGAPHFYQANGPVPTRPDAKTTKSPWLARDVEATLGWSFPAVVMPFSAVNYPFYNGEVGKYGHEVLLSKIEGQKAAEIMVEAALVQQYAVGMVGGLEWTLWGDNGDFDPYTDIYARQMQRFSPVYDAGPVDRQKADVAFVQNSEAVPSSNGHNFGCVPLAKLVLDLHLPPVHYLTDEQFRYTTSAELSVGLEQVVETAGAIHYKAIIADRRKLDAKVEATLKALTTPVLFIDDAAQLTAEKLAAFLKTANVAYDDKTPKQIQLTEGPQHLIAYRRLDGGANPSKIFPKLQKTGPITLTDEKGKIVFTGDAGMLATQGLSIDLPLWTSAIFKIDSK